MTTSRQRRKQRRAEERRKAAIHAPPSFPEDESIPDEDITSVVELDLSEDPNAELDAMMDSGTPEGPELDAEPKSVEKMSHHDEMAPAMQIPANGPTSWEELDAYRDEVEKAREIRAVTWDAEGLISNIVHNPMMEPEEKAGAMSQVAAGFSKRLKGMTAKSLDPDVLYIEALLKCSRETGDGVLDAMKEVLSGGARSSLPDSAFALVVVRDGKKVRKYPIHDKAHVRNALARAAQMMKRGGQAASDAKAALPKIRAAARKMGIGTPAEGKKSAITIEKDSEGNYRWIGWVSNNFIDRDGEYLTEDAHKEYVAWLDANPDLAPVSLSYHEPISRREKSVDWWTYENGFLMMSGPLTEKEAMALMKVASEVEIGMSHGFFPLERNPDNRKEITKYRTYEVSDLPLRYAANPFTTFETMTKEVNMDKIQYLSRILGSDEKAREFVNRAGIKQAELRAEGVSEKEIMPDTDAPEQKEEPETLPTLTPEGVKALVEHVVKAVGETYSLEEVTSALAEMKSAVALVPDLVKAIQAGQESDEERLARMLTPGAARSKILGTRPSNSNANLLNEARAEDAELKDSKPDGKNLKSSDWLSAAFGAEPVQVDATNM